MRTPPYEKSLAYLNPSLASEWSEKNILTPDKVYPNSLELAWWKCNTCDYEWEKTVNYRSQRGKCPACLKQTNKIPAPLQKWALADDLNFYTKGSNKKIQWTCPTCNYSWVQMINRFVKKPKCIPCSKSQTPSNSLTENFPLLEKEFSSANKKEIKDLTAGSAYKASWVCSKCSHEWIASVFARTKGSGCPACAIKNRKFSVQKSLKDVAPHLAKEWADTNPQSMSDFSYGSGFKADWVCSDGHRWSARISDRVGAGKSCPKCVNKVSKAEDDIFTYFQKYDIEIIRGNRKIIPPLEIDLFFPEKKLAVEFNGLYWHSEARNLDKKYHYNKFLRCQEKGIQLIQIWEDDWSRNPELILNLISYKLNLKTLTKVNARNTKARIITSVSTVKDFLEKYHIQGFASGSHYLGLFLEQELVSVAVFTETKKGNKVYNLIRFASKYSVVGGFSKLISYFSKNFLVNEIFTFSDNTVSNGLLYDSNGFTAVKNLPPDYMYIVKGKREHKFKYRLRKFKTDPTLIWIEGKTEKELASLNNMPRIWDAGKIKWVKKIASS